jgi:TonB family protein
VCANTVGQVGETEILRPLHPELDAAAVAAFREWSFNPATRDGQPVPVVVTVEMTFRLK